MHKQCCNLAGLVIGSLIMAGLSLGAEAQNTVYSPHPLTLDTSQARSLPGIFPAFMVPPQLGAGAIGGACCAIILSPGVSAWIPMPGLNPGWQDISYQVPVSLLDGSRTEGGRRIYQSGSFYPLETTPANDHSPFYPFRRIVILPAP